MQHYSTTIEVMKKILMLLSSFLMLTLADAQPVGEQEAMVKAHQFLLNRTENACLDQAAQVYAARGTTQGKTPELTLASNRDEYYVFNDEANGGYVIVSGEDRMPDVLVYSRDGHYDADHIPCNMQAWLEDYAMQVAYLRLHPEAKVTTRSALERKNVSPLLTCWFNQGTYYNEKCPEVNGEHCMTGCVATAMAQIMYYYQWPKQTSDIIPAYKTGSYKIDMPAQPITTIDWENILNKYTEGKDFTEEQINAISTLMLLCGTSIRMDYTPKSSGAMRDYIAKAFLNYFGYKDMLELIVRGDFDTDDWEELIYDEVKSRRPVLYSGYSDEGSHTFVIDGYEDGYFHVNWGWGGAYSYVLMTDVEGWEGLTKGHYALMGIQADSPGSPRQYAVLDNGIMTLYYDAEMDSRSGTLLSNLNEISRLQQPINKCVIDPSFADIKLKSLQGFFNRWNMKEISGLEHLNTLRVTDMSSMFSSSGLTSIDLAGLRTEKVTNMNNMFSGCSSLKSVDMSGLNTEKVDNTARMFSFCNNLTKVNLRGLKLSNVTDMSSMFEHCPSLTSVDMSETNTENLTNVEYMFYCCNSLESIDLSGLITDHVTNMGFMFCECYSLAHLDLSRFKTDHVTNMMSLFSNCTSLTSLDLSRFKTDNVTNMDFMFFSCSNLTSLDLSSFDTKKVKSIWRMFWRDERLSTIYVSEKWDMSNVKTSDAMFYGCSSIVGGAGTTYDENHTDYSYAHIDEGLGNPGYLTYKSLLGIPAIRTKPDKTSIYAPSGRRLNKPQKGLNIIRTSDGMVRKVTLHPN